MTTASWSPEHSTFPHYFVKDDTKKLHMPSHYPSHTHTHTGHMVTVRFSRLEKQLCVCKFRCSHSLTLITFGHMSEIQYKSKAFLFIICWIKIKIIKWLLVTSLHVFF